MILIAAADRNWGIGKDGAQPVYLKDDLRRFRALTLGKTVILGRKTLAALPGGKPLPGRTSLVLSADPAFSVEGAQVFRSVDELLAHAPADSVVMGGGQVYSALLPYCTAAYLTKIHAVFPADTFLPDLDALPEWTVTEQSPTQEENGVAYHYVTYQRSEV